MAGVIVVVGLFVLIGFLVSRVLTHRKEMSKLKKGE